MDLNFTAEEQAFREQVRAFLADKLPEDIRETLLSGRFPSAEHIRRWQQILHEKGWGAPSWPTEFGGPGWGPVERYIFEEETALAGAPRQLPFGLSMVGPVVMQFGSDEQKAKYLPRIISAEDWWCQGYSEPNSGSDLASLQMRAERRGDHYLCNGQKTWTTLAQHANLIFCLVRTDTQSKQQEGISFLLIDMETPGVTVRPIVLLDGRVEVNEVWFENVEVPVENLVGEENQGWTIAKFLLGHERSNTSGMGYCKRELRRLKGVAAEQTKNGAPLIEDPRFAASVAQVEIDMMALEITSLRVLADEAQQRAPGPESSLLKIRGTEIQQELTRLLAQAIGADALAFYPDLLEGEANGPQEATFAPNYFNMRKATIYAGSNEIQRNIIAKRVLGV